MSVRCRLTIRSTGRAGTRLIFGRQSVGAPVTFNVRRRKLQVCDGCPERALAGRMTIHSRIEAAMDWKQVITADPQILHGAVRFDGTRIPVTVVLDNLADGATPDEILEQFPSLRPEHIPAALAYAADLARERVVPIPA